MRYFVGLGGREIAVDVTALAGGSWDVRVEGNRSKVDAVAAGAAVSLLIDGRVVDLVLDATAPKVGYAALGCRGEARIETERTRAEPSLGRADTAKGGDSLVAPMPGRIVRVLVAAGDHVETGAPLVVIEAMKMENELRATRAAEVRDVLVRAGDTIEGGVKLIVLE
ncbi:MAG TPA: biotin/lipoyl-containing protein [Polyangiaceae bacterium]